MHVALKLLRLRIELLSARALLWLASAGRDVELKPETSLYLADLHFRVAAAYKDGRKFVLSRRYRTLANKYAAAGPPQPPRPAAAMAMPIPTNFTFTDARGTVVDYDSDDAV